MRTADWAWRQFCSLGIGEVRRLKEVMYSLSDTLASSLDPLEIVELMQSTISEMIGVLTLPPPRFLLETRRFGVVAYGPYFGDGDDVWEVAFRPESIVAVTSARRRIRKLLRATWNVVMYYLCYHHDGGLTFLVLEQFSTATARLCDVEALWRPRFSNSAGRQR